MNSPMMQWSEKMTGPDMLKKVGKEETKGMCLTMVGFIDFDFGVSFLVGLSFVVNRW